MKIFYLTFFLLLLTTTGFTNPKETKAGATKQLKQDLLYKSLKYSYIALNVADVAITFYNVDHGAKEVGPIGKYIIHNKPVAILVKAGAVGFSIWALDATYKDDKRIAYGALIGLNALYTWAFYGNFKVYLKLRK